MELHEGRDSVKWRSSLEPWFSRSVGPTCNPLDSSPPGSSVHGVSEARILECVAVSFSRAPS